MKLKNSSCSFCDAVYELIALIPAGLVSTYGDIAKGVGYPGYARGVAWCMRKMPKDTQLPWFRVVRSNLTIALPPGSKGACMQEQLLRQEGAMKDSHPVKARRWIYE